MNNWLIFLWIEIAFVAMAFWESSVEGRNAWDKKKLGWKIRFSRNISVSRYHFYLFFITLPVLLVLPFVIYGRNFELFGVIVSAYFFGMVLEDILWFIVNPVVKFREWNPKFANYYPWLCIGKFRVPVYYILDLGIAFISWAFIWR